MSKLAPIVLFAYNRPWHTQQTVEALQKNKLASESELFIYSDEAKNDDARVSVDEVRKYIDNITGFKKITVIKRDKNWGLADSIIDGVTKIVNEYGRIIVLEDDLVTSPYFLQFMNESLEFYEDEEKIWHVSGWNYPIETDGLNNVFLCRVMNCWGWATWADRWRHYEKDVDKTMEEFSKDDIKRFNLDGVEDFFGQVTANYEKKINTWAIFWYATIFKHEGLCLNPAQTFVENIGLDASGENCGISTMYTNKNILNDYNYVNASIAEDDVFLEKIKDFYKMNKKTNVQKLINYVSYKYYRSFNFKNIT